MRITAGASRAVKKTHRDSDTPGDDGPNQFLFFKLQN